METIFRTLKTEDDAFNIIIRFATGGNARQPEIQLCSQLSSYEFESSNFVISDRGNHNEFFSSPSPSVNPPHIPSLYSKTFQPQHTE